MLNRHGFLGFVVAMSLCGLDSSVIAAEPDHTVYVQIPATQLTITEGQAPSGDARVQIWEYLHPLPRVCLDGPGRAMILGSQQTEQGWMWPMWSQCTLVAQAPAAGPITGRIDYFVDGKTQSLRFKLDADKNTSTDAARRAFYQAMKLRYQNLMSRDLPGGAWFRHQYERASVELKEGTPRSNATRPPQWSRPNRELDAYALFSGGRAISENLQLDRTLPDAQASDQWVDVDTLDGVTVRPYDFAAQLTEPAVPMDRLAEYVPADQHIVVFPSFDAAVAAVDQIQTHGALVQSMMQPRSQYVGVFEFYQQQLALQLTQLSRQVGPMVIRSVALTGGDPYFPTGTDIAVLFETDQPTALKLWIGQQQAAAVAGSDARFAGGTIQDVAYVGVTNPNRSICSYTATLDDHVVVVTNSLIQLKRLVQVQRSAGATLASLPEYRFFRQRYPLGDVDEQAYIMLSDATIRRWCSPRWRIGAARRLRAASILADVHCRYADALITNAALPEKLNVDLSMPGGVDELTLDHSGARNATYNTLRFLTPIDELDIDQVTRSEADLYQRWRTGYERNWSNFFDPIAVRLTIQPGRLATDVSVIPLILGSQYNQLAQLTQGIKLKPGSGDPHAAARAHLVMALNRDSPPMRQIGNFALSMAPQAKVDMLGWIGESVSLYADDDPFWDEMRNADRPEDFAEHNLARLPIALRVEVKDPLKLALFLAAMRGWMESTSPNLTLWDNIQHGDQTYVRIHSRQGEQWAICYAATPTALILSPSQRVIESALDRQNAPAAPDAAPQPWLGESLALKFDQEAMSTVFQLFGNDFTRAAQRRSWANLPILNVWKRLYPDRDPVQMHRQMFGTTLVCPGGGQYVWSDEDQTMRSTACGDPLHPVDIKSTVPPNLTAVKRAHMGLTLTGDSLRARAELLLNKPQ